MRPMRCALVLGLALVSGAAQASQSFEGCWPITLGDVARFDPPTFERYLSEPVTQTPSAVDLTSHPNARRYRTVLRTQAAKGSNFAGHYTVAGWGCGTSCVQFAIIDTLTGRVYFPPHILSVSSDHVDMTKDEPASPFYSLRYRTNSRLLVIVGALNDDDTREGIGYYEWTGMALKRVRWFKSTKKGWCEK
jgi:hypothetical protein